MMPANNLEVGDPLTAADLAALERCFIPPQLAVEARIFRVDSAEGARIVGRNGGGNYAGLVFPYCWPGEDSPREYRLRRDHPDLEQRTDGSVREKGKYIGPVGRGNLLYLVPGTQAALLKNAELPVVLVEGEKKTLAVHRLAFHNTSSMRFLPIGLSGVWSWRGVVGKSSDERGARQDVKGPVPDLDRIVWLGRTVHIIFDTNVSSNESVRAARLALAKEVKRRGADVRFVDLPVTENVNGVDDLLATLGADYVLGLIDAARPFDAPRQQKTQATRIVELASDVQLFHTTDNEPYARFRVGAHYETWPLKSRGFRDWLTRQLYKSEGRAPASQSLQDALNVLSSRARFEGECQDVHLRVAQHERKIYVDLADADWRIVEVSAGGWRVINNQEAPVKFRRSLGMLPLPEPVLGSVNSLRAFVNVTDEQWPLFLSALVAYFRPARPFPILCLHGEQGSSKSTVGRVVRSLVDPNKAGLRSEPRDERDLVIAATNSWMISLDNLSKISPWLSDALCRLATGGGFGTRRLYENDEEVLFNSIRPIILNGIEELATRGDLLDRALVLNLPTIPEENRKTESEFWANFDRDRPGILGALLSAVSCALERESNVHLERSPRLADFATWAVAAEPALGLNDGEFLRAYMGNRETANDFALESSPVSTALLDFLDDNAKWNGTSSELLAELNSRVPDDVKKQPGWPKSAQGLGGILKRLAPNLRSAGISVQHGTGRERRSWFLERSGNYSSPLSPSS